jgi:large subunit ribosomal protein L4
MNKKERRKALFSALSAKAQSGLVIVDDIKLKEIKTKDMVKVINNLPLEGKTLVALPEKNEVLQKSASNIPTVKSLTVNYLNIHDLLKYENLLLTKSSLEKINEIFVK